MKRTQVQIPEPLYAEIKRVAAIKDWSIAEVLRRGAEYIVACHPSSKTAESSLPAPVSLGEFLAPVERWRELAEDPVERLLGE